MSAASNAVVVNTGPLLALGACGQIDLLRALHTRVVVPQLVVDELAVGGSTALPTGLDRSAFPWIEVLSLAGPIPPGLLLALDAGEASVIALALELGISRVLVDERRGRQVARALGLAVAGSVGVLLRAKNEGLLPAVRPSIDAMRAAGIWLSDALVAAVLGAAGEA